MQNTLFVGDLSIFCTEDDLRELFEKFGELSEVKIIRCEETKKNLSYGFVKYVETEAAVKANEELNGTMLCGRPLRFVIHSFFCSNIWFYSFWHLSRHQN